MTDDRRDIAAAFDLRSARYSRSQWHRAYAEGLIAHSALRLGDRVLDAGVGTGFAAMAAAVRVGPQGRVVGVDVSPGMLQQAQVSLEAMGLGNVELLQADACELRDLPDASFDAVVCSAALLYIRRSPWRKSSMRTPQSRSIGTPDRQASSDRICALTFLTKRVVVPAPGMPNMA